uniref:DAGKc domain-containing protein n=1 Tax=Leersia perrieri TaxID=77586 RepID=A0A0D9W7P9_9ORYZ
MEVSDLENPTSRSSSQKSSRRSGSRRSQKSAGQQSSPTVFPEKKSKSKSSRQKHLVFDKDSKKAKNNEQNNDVADEKSNFLGYEIYSGKLFFDKKNRSTGDQISANGKANTTDIRLTSKALVWGSSVLSLEDVVSVSYSSGAQHFIVHAYPSKKYFFGKTQRVRKDLRFIAPTVEEAISWVTCFAEQNIYVNILPRPPTSNTEQDTDGPFSLFDYPPIKCRTPQRILVILNPRSGHGRSCKVFHDKAEPIFKLAGFHMEVVKTTHAGHAKSLASTFDVSAFPDGIVCVGGDGIVNEVFNGLLSRSDRAEAVSIPVGIIPAGSDNSLVWTVLGVKDPISASLLIVKGGFTALDILAVEWIQSGLIHFGTTVSYYGFISDVLELSEKYQKKFGPLRYFVAGILKFFCLPSYFYELEYLPSSKEMVDHGKGTGQDNGVSDIYHNVMRSRSKREGIPRASSLSSIDSIMTPSRMSLGDVDTSGSTAASTEPSDYVRGLDPKAKRLSLGRSNIVSEPEEVLHPQPHHGSFWQRTRSKQRTERNSVGVTTNDTRLSWAAPSMHDKEDISSTISDPGPIWDSEPKWDTGPKWDTDLTWEPDHQIELPGPPENEIGPTEELVPNLDDKWVVRKGHFLGVLVCNHSCKTVQSLSSQVIAPKANHDDNTLDLLLVGGRGRWKLLKFFVLLQFGRHLSLPYVEYVKVKSVKLKPGANTHNGCGIDGELCRVKGHVLCTLLREQCMLIGRQSRQST